MKIKWISGFENKYEITSDGKIFYHKKGLKRERKSCFDKDGYKIATLKKDGRQITIKVHREVAKAFLKTKQKETVNHINGIKHDNRIENLEWCTFSENNKHKIENGLYELGKKNKNNTSGYYGVSFNSGKFQARVIRNKKEIHLGMFNTAKEANKEVQKFIRYEKETK